MGESARRSDLTQRAVLDAIWQGSVASIAAMAFTALSRGETPDNIVLLAYDADSPWPDVFAHIGIPMPEVRTAPPGHVRLSVSRFDRTLIPVLREAFPGMEEALDTALPEGECRVLLFADDGGIFVSSIEPAPHPLNRAAFC